MNRCNGELGTKADANNKPIVTITIGKYFEAAYFLIGVKLLY